MAGAWIAAGSVGLVAGPLQRVLVWIALGTAAVAGLGQRKSTPLSWLLLTLAIAIGLVMTASTLPAAGVLAVALVTAVLAHGQDGLARRVITLAAMAIAVGGLFQVALGIDSRRMARGRRLGTRVG